MFKRNIQIKNFISNNVICVFTVLVFTLSWSVWGILIASCNGIISDFWYDKMYLFLYCLGGFTPGAVSLFLTLYLYKKEGTKRLLSGLVKWKVNPFCYAFALFYWLFLYYSSSLIGTAIGLDKQLNVQSNIFYVLYLFIFILFLGGPLGEELGWRGFLLPKLQLKTNPLKSGLIVGVIWALWHTPLFFIPGTGQYMQSMSLFMGNLICFSILLTWLYNKTRGSLILTMLFHASFNTVTGIISDFRGFTLLHLKILILLQITFTIIFAFSMITKKDFHTILKTKAK